MRSALAVREPTTSAAADKQLDRRSVQLVTVSVGYAHGASLRTQLWTNDAKLVREAVAEFKLSPKEADRCKNFFALGLVYWLYERPMETTLKWIREKFAKNPQYVNANTAALRAGYNYGETVELLPVQYQVAKAKIANMRWPANGNASGVSIGSTTARAVAASASPQLLMIQLGLLSCANSGD